MFFLAILHVTPDVLPGYVVRSQMFFLVELDPPDVLPGWAIHITCTPDDFPG